MARAGQRDRRVTVLRARLVEGALEDRVEFDAVATVWAEYAPLSDGEQVRALQVGARQTARFTILWRSDLAELTGQDQLVLHPRRRGQGDQTFGISGVKDLAGVEIEITAACEQVRPV